MSDTATPLKGPPPSEVPLDNAPLIRVIAQVRFPVIASVEKREFIAPFQEAIRREYPVLRSEQSRGVVVSSQGVVDARSTSVWRFHGADGAWRVTLAPDFLALETEHYSSRDDFLGRFRRVLQALDDHLEPQLMDRLGVRYIDRVTGDNYRDLPALVRPEVAGVLGSALGEAVQHSVSESLLVLPDGSGAVLARWGSLPARSTVDPAAVDPIDEPSWLLDLDAFNSETKAFSVDTTVEQARAFTERIYSVFRWAVTEEFLKRYGGDV